MPGRFCLVLHAHLPFVRHPEYEDFLEESWLFEAITECYLPLLRVLESLAEDQVPYRAAMTVSPTLSAMLADELLLSRYARRLDQLVDLAGREARRTAGLGSFGALSRFYLARFEQARLDFHDRFRRDLLAALRRLRDAGRLELVACAATHAFLPLLSPVPSSVTAQVEVGLDSHRRAFGEDPKGFWIPECGYFPSLDADLVRAGIRYVVLDAHGLTLAAPRPRYGVFAPVLTGHGLCAFGRDPDSSTTIWSAQEGYPGHPDYRDFYRDIGFDLPAHDLGPFVRPTGARAATGIKYHRVTGRTEEKEPYDRGRAMERVVEHARDFLARKLDQLDAVVTHMNGRDPVVVAPYDAELFGHWWFEGPEFLEAFLREASGKPERIRLETPSDCLRAEPSLQIVELPMSSWGHGGFAGVWLDDANAWIWREVHRAGRKMATLASRHEGERAPLVRRALNQAARELLLAEASDWAFMIRARTTVDYAIRRTREHLANFDRLHADVASGHVREAFVASLESRHNVFPQIDFGVYARP